MGVTIRNRTYWRNLWINWQLQMQKKFFVSSRCNHIYATRLTNLSEIRLDLFSLIWMVWMKILNRPVVDSDCIPLSTRALLWTTLTWTRSNSLYLRLNNTENTAFLIINNYKKERIISYYKLWIIMMDAYHSAMYLGTKIIDICFPVFA